MKMRNDYLAIKPSPSINPMDVMVSFALLPYIPYVILYHSLFTFITNFNGSHLTLNSYVLYAKKHTLILCIIKEFGLVGNGFEYPPIQSNLNRLVCYSLACSLAFAIANTLHAVSSVYNK